MIDVKDIFSKEIDWLLGILYAVVWSSVTYYFSIDIDDHFVEVNEMVMPIRDLEIVFNHT